jgi:hypothetical protein
MNTTNNSFSIGDTGPGGGIVFYIDNTEIHGLETRPATEVHAMAWSAAADYVASLVRTFGPGWRLPTIAELQLLYQQRKAVGGFDRGDFHWSFSEVDNDRALCSVDNTGGVYTLRKRGDSCFVRPIRDFGPDDPIRMETKGDAVRVNPGERITWSKHWHYNYDRDFSQREKDEILESVKTTGLRPHPQISQGFTMENSKFDVFIYLTNGVWEINGATRKSSLKEGPSTSAPDCKDSTLPPKTNRAWWQFWKKS